MKHTPEPVLQILKQHQVMIDSDGVFSFIFKQTKIESLIYFFIGRVLPALYLALTVAGVVIALTIEPDAIILSFSIFFMIFPLVLLKDRPPLSIMFDGVNILINRAKVIKGEYEILVKLDEVKLIKEVMRSNKGNLRTELSLITEKRSKVLLFRVMIKHADEHAVLVSFFEDLLGLKAS